MAHYDIYLEPCPGYGWQGGPEFKTQIVELQSGRERRNGMWAKPRRRFAAPYNNISREAYMEILTVHEICQGSLHAFRFRDELDNEADQESFGIGDGETTTFQLLKSYTKGPYTRIREIYAPVSAIVVTVDGVVATPTVDYLRGTVEFETAPAENADIKWTGNFDVWVRFNQDYLPFTLNNINATNGSVDLIEVPPPEPVA